MVTPQVSQTSGINKMSKRNPDQVTQHSQKLIIAKIESIFLSLSLSNFFKLTVVAQNTDLSIEKSSSKSSVPEIFCKLPNARSSSKDSEPVEEGDKMFVF